MMARSHFAGGLFAAAIANAAGWLPAVPALVILTPFMALLPDVDTPVSTIGARVKIISVPLSMTTRHRGMTHSILAAALVFALAAYGLAPVLADVGVPVAFPVGLGLAMSLSYGSHMLLDMISGGAEALWPVMGRIGIKAVATGGVADYAIAIVLGGSASWYWWTVMGMRGFG